MKNLKRCPKPQWSRRPIFSQKSKLRLKKSHDEQNTKILNKVRTSNICHAESETEREDQLTVIWPLLLFTFYTQGECLTCLTLALALVGFHWICFSVQQAVCHTEIIIRMLVLARKLEHAMDNESYFIELALTRRMSCFLLFPLPLTTSTDNPRERHKHWPPTVLNFLKALNQAFKMGCINAVSDYLHLQCETRAILSKQTHTHHRSDWCYHLKHVLYFSLGLKNTWEKSVCKNDLYKIWVPNGLKICLETHWSKGKYNDSACLCSAVGRKHATQSIQGSPTHSQRVCLGILLPGNERTPV